MQQAGKGNSNFLKSNGDDNEIHAYLIGAANSRESAVRRSKNEYYIKDLGEVRRSRHNSSFPAPTGYKMP